MTKPLRIVVLGIMGRIPFAGLAWEALHYVEGFRRLGHDVYYIEDSQDWPFDPDRQALSEDPTYTLNFIARNLEMCGMSDRWAYRAVAQENRIYGLSDTRFARVFDEADLLVNVCGATMLRDEHLRVPVRAYVETDPGLPQIELAKGDPSTHELMSVHTHHFTFAENLGAPDCGLPQGPFAYRFTRQPIVLDWFTPSSITGRGFPRRSSVRQHAAASASSSNGSGFTTVSSWKQTSNDIEWNGQLYTWSKHSEFLKFIDLPRRIGRTLEIALACDEQDIIDLFRSKGWRIRDALDLTRDIWPYRDYVVRSRGEFTVAKDQNVRLRSGWFSERSASYLTASKPVITQDTGFGAAIPTGEGLFAYNTMDEIVAAFEAIDSDYGRHSRAARAIAEEYFRAETVLARLIDDVGL